MEMMTDPPLYALTRYLTIRCKLKISPGHGMMIDPTHIVVDQNLTENFKFRTLGLGQGKMIDPYQYCTDH